MNDKTDSIIYWDQFFQQEFQEQPFYIAATARGLCRVTWPSETFASLQNWVTRRFPQSLLIHDPNRLSAYIGQLKQYFSGERKAFDLPMDMQGTSFQQSVWLALTQIPCGQTTSYSNIAMQINRPKATRAVGTAIGENPISVVVPCHRVIGKNGALTGFRGGLNMKEKLLELEGVNAYVKEGHERYKF